MAIVVSNKKRIFYTIEGERGPFVLLHHGLFGSHQDWYDWGYVDALSNDYRLILIDARGHGRSDKPDNVEAFTLDEMANDVLAVMDALGVRNIQFFGHSFASAIGLHFILRYPERSRGGMLGGETPLPTGEQKAVWKKLAEDIENEGFSVCLSERRSKGLLLGVTRDVTEEEETVAPIILEAMQSWEEPEQETIRTDAPLTLFIGALDSTIPQLKAARSKMSRSRLFIMAETTFQDALVGVDLLVQEMNSTMRSAKSGEREDGGRERKRREPDGKRNQDSRSRRNSGGKDESRNTKANDEAQESTGSEVEVEIDSGAIVTQSEMNGTVSESVNVETEIKRGKEDSNGKGAHEIQTKVDEEGKPEDTVEE